MLLSVCLVRGTEMYGSWQSNTILEHSSAGATAVTISSTGRHFRAIILWQQAAASNGRPAIRPAARSCEAKYRLSSIDEPTTNIVLLPPRQIEKTPIRAALRRRKLSDSRFCFRWPRHPIKVQCPVRHWCRSPASIPTVPQVDSETSVWRRRRWLVAAHFVAAVATKHCSRGPVTSRPTRAAWAVPRHRLKLDPGDIASRAEAFVVQWLCAL